MYYDQRWWIAFALVSVFPFEASGICNRWYRVTSGDFCYKIWSDNGLTEERLNQLNPGLNCDALGTGDTLCLSKTNGTLTCTKIYKIATGDYCFKVWTDHGLTERQFNDLNPSLNCNSLQANQIVCVESSEVWGLGTAAPAITSPPTTTPATTTTVVKPRPPSDSTARPDEPNVFSCGEFYAVAQGDTCYSISTSFGLNLEDFQSFNRNINCDALNIGDQVCVSSEYLCQLRHKVNTGDTCFNLRNAYKLTIEQLAELNPNVNCDALQVGYRLCVASANSRPIPTMSCKLNYQIKKGDTCWALALSNGISVDELNFLNPQMQCDSLHAGADICVSGENSAKCAAFVSVGSATTCEDIMLINNLKNADFLKLNPTIDCDHINEARQVCIGQGYFKADHCLEHIRITTEDATCATIASSLKFSTEQLTSMNPQIDCRANLTLRMLVCTKTLDGVNVQVAQESFVNAIGKVAPEVTSAYTSYQQSPSEENEEALYSKLIAALVRDNVYTVLKQQYFSNKDVRKLIDAGTPQLLDRNTLCGRMQTLAYSQKTRECVCNPDDLFFYCRVLMTADLQAAIHQLSRRRRSVSATQYFDKQSRGNRTKREEIPVAGCELSLPDDQDGIENGCFGGGCSVPMGPFSLNVEATFCVPVIKVAKEQTEICMKEKDECTNFNLKVQGLKQAAEMAVGGSISLCLGPAKFRILKDFGLQPCWTVVSASYQFFVGKLTIESEIDVELFTIKGGAAIKVHDMAYPPMCEMEDFNCEDYCLWRHYNEPNGKAYGMIEFRALSLGSLSGFKLFDFKFNNPRRAGCLEGEEASILIFNRRTCDTPTWVRCWSGDDRVDWRIVDKDEELSFAFKPWARTLWVCEFVLVSTGPDGHKIGFDVYGGTSKLKGKSNFWYAIKNDGVYYGSEREREDVEKGKWKKECVPETDDDNNGNNGNENNGNGNVQSVDPTGQSSVSAASCGKRIVGYYTAWGKRDVSLNQLRKLTHIVFGFVAMSSDGTLSFDAVADGSENGEEPSAKSRRRFDELRQKVRIVNAGVSMIFAVGGWENSQYFSSIASNSGSRSKFIENIANFLKQHKIDGVDLDWEYPVTGGAHEGVPADKENFVTLLRELRERLTKLQSETGRKSKYIISLASAAGEWTLRPGYDLDKILQYADFINVMTYDYYGAWGSKWGAYTGPPAPLYFGSPKGFSGKLNTDFTLKYYSCNTKKPSQLNMGVPFYGRYWENVGDAIDPKDPMWRTASAVGGAYVGGYVGWRDIGNSGWSLGSAVIHDKVKAPYIYDAGSRKFLGFENEKSLRYKVDYAIEKNIGGLMIWAIDLDDDADTLLSIVSSADLCSGGSGDSVSNYKCVPINDIRWWNPENGGESKQGMCGRSAPLINGYYPVCDPDDPGYACCGTAGYCGSGDEYCKCDTCVDYRQNPEKILNEPVKPSRSVQWYSMDAPDGSRGRCGKEAPKLNGAYAICNPDDPSKHCCSNGNYCGTGAEFCNCDGCIDFSKNPSYQWS